MAETMMVVVKVEGKEALFILSSDCTACRAGRG